MILLFLLLSFTLFLRELIRKRHRLLTYQAVYLSIMSLIHVELKLILMRHNLKDTCFTG